MGKGTRPLVRSANHTRPATASRWQNLTAVGANVVVLETTPPWTVADLPGGFVCYSGQRGLGANWLTIENGTPIVVEKGSFRCSCGAPPPCEHRDLVLRVAMRFRERGWAIRSGGNENSGAVAPYSLSLNRYRSRSGLVVRGQVFLWGDLPTWRDPSLRPAAIAIPLRFSRLHDVVEVSDGDAFALARDRDGRVWRWTWEQTTHPHDAPALETVLSPHIIFAERPVPAMQLAVGREHGLILDAAGQVWSLGVNHYGQLGLGATAQFHVDRPHLVPGLDAIVAVAAGEHASYALRSDGTVFSWGCNSSYQLGLPTRQVSVPHPEPVRGPLERVRVTALAAGPTYVLALTDEGQVWGWGNNAHRQLAANGFAATNGPIRLRELQGVRAVSAGRAHALALLEDGRVLAWGSCSLGELGIFPSDPETRSSDLPFPIPNLSDVVAIAAGYDANLGVRRDGSLIAWGRNVSGALGLGKTSHWEPPTPVPGVRLPSPERREGAIVAP